MPSSPRKLASSPEKPRSQPRDDAKSPPSPTPDLSLLLLSLYLFLLPLFGGFLEDLKPAGLLLLLLAAAGIRLWEARKPGRAPLRLWPGWPVAAFFLWAILTAFTGADWRVSYNALLFIGAGILTYLLVADGVKTPVGRMWLFGGILSGAGVTGAIALREYLLTVRMDPTWRTFATFQNPNLLADYLLPSLFLGLTGILIGKRPWLIGTGFLTLLCAIGLILTGSRGAVVYSLPVAFVVWAALSHLSRDADNPQALRVQQLRLAAILVAGLALGAFFLKPTAARVGSAASAGESNSSQFRLLTWKGTLALIKERPVFGWGPGVWEYAYPPVARAGYTKAAHNSYLQAAAELGLPGLLLWLWVLFDGLGGARRGNMAEAGRTAALVAVMLHNGVDYGWLLFGPWGLTWALLAARPIQPSSQTDVEVKVNSPSPDRPSPGIGGGVGERALPALVFTLSVLLTALGLLPAYAEWTASQAQDAMAAGNPILARQSYEQAATLDPTESDWPREAGRVSLYAMRDPQAAIAEYLEAIRGNPLRATLYYSLGQAYEAAGQTAAAAKSFEDALKRDPFATPPLMEYARLEEARGHAARAMELYRRIAAVQDSPVGQVKALSELEDPNFALARARLAEDDLKRGDTSAARRDIEAGLKSANAYLEGMKTWRKVMEAQNRYRPEQEAQMRSVRNNLARMKERLDKG